MTSVIEQFGALGVFLLMVPESACIPIPSEVTLLFAGYAVTQGWMSLPLAVLARDRRQPRRLGARIRPRCERTAAADPGGRAGAGTRWEALLDRHGTRAVFVARLLPLARTFVSLPAGARRVALGRFLVLTAAGCALWAVAFVLLGHGRRAPPGARSTRCSGACLLGVGLAVIAASLARRGR